MRSISLKICLNAGKSSVFEYLTTSKGRSSFWAEKADEANGVIQFVFPNGETYDSKIISVKPNEEFHLDYFHSFVKFILKSSESGGTELLLINEKVPEPEFEEVYAGWVSVLMNLKAVADFNCDLRNHDPKKTWDQGYVNN